MDSTLQRIRAVCAATARLLSIIQKQYHRSSCVVVCWFRHVVAQQNVVPCECESRPTLSADKCRPTMSADICLSCVPALRREERLPYQNNTCIHWISSTLVNTRVVPIRKSCQTSGQTYRQQVSVADLSSGPSIRSYTLDRATGTENAMDTLIVVEKYLNTGLHAHIMFITKHSLFPVTACIWASQNLSHHQKNVTSCTVQAIYRVTGNSVDKMNKKELMRNTLGSLSV